MFQMAQSQQKSIHQASSPTSLMTSRTRSLMKQQVILSSPRHQCCSPHMLTAASPTAAAPLRTSEPRLLSLPGESYRSRKKLVSLRSLASCCCCQRLLTPPPCICTVWTLALGRSLSVVRHVTCEVPPPTTTPTTHSPSSTLQFFLNASLSDRHSPKTFVVPPLGGDICIPPHPHPHFPFKVNGNTSGIFCLSNAGKQKLEAWRGGGEPGGRSSLITI